MLTTRIQDLTRQYFSGGLPEAAWEELAAWVDGAEESEVQELLGMVWEQLEPTERMPELMAQRILARVFAEGQEEEDGGAELNSEEEEKKREEEKNREEDGGAELNREEEENEEAFVVATPVRRMISRRWIAAAMIFLLLGSGAFWLWVRTRVHTDQGRGEVVVADVAAPVTNRARITLGNGQVVYLDSAKDGMVVKQGKMNLVKVGDGQVRYSPLPASPGGGGGETSAMVYNTLSNPRGSKVINITLSDGSQVWLNAESSLRYPTVFNDKERKVEITGEAYFEVTHTPSTGGGRGRPFIVSKGNVSVTVLGTHFNVNAYADEASLDVTLLEGSVKVEREKISQLLKPGEQAKVTLQQIALNKTVNTEEVMAWKNGLFLLRNMEMGTLLRQLGRWYAVDVQYENNRVPAGHITGTLPRTTNLSNVLKILEYSGLKVQLEGRVLKVSE